MSSVLVGSAVVRFSGLEFFRPSEFGVWAAVMDRELLLRLDEFRRKVGVPVKVNSSGRVGRVSSQHFPAPFVRAVDVVVLGAEDAREIVDVAVGVGFSGVGYYPGWSGGVGLHLDVRRGREQGSPALWSGVDDGGGNVYRSIEWGLGKDG